ncbi:MAG: amino acid ABC transporter permease [Rhizobiaceae bacterium]|nr:amino acid ABC transporter permease [Rhizobiaceae bacterium]
MDVDLVLRHSGALIDGARITLAITLVGAIIAISGGSAICAMRISSYRTLRAFARANILFFRVTPEVILIFWAYYCIPLIFDTTVSGFWSGSVVLGLIGAAYLAEIFRAGIAAVPRGQSEAAEALGLKAFPKWTFVILPQALKLVIAPLVNYFSEFLKNTTLLSAIGVMDLSLQAYLLGGQTFQYLSFLSAIAIIYFAMIFPVTLYARHLEAKLSDRSARPAGKRSFWRRKAPPEEVTANP